MISRTAGIVKIARLLKPNIEQFSQKVRNGHHDWNYRIATNNHPKVVTYSAEIVGGFAWWWILWHLWTEPGHVTGEFDYPIASKWTDEELGIPPDE